MRNAPERRPLSRPLAAFAVAGFAAVLLAAPEGRSQVVIPRPERIRHDQPAPDAAAPEAKPVPVQPTLPVHAPAEPDQPARPAEPAQSDPDAPVTAPLTSAPAAREWPFELSPAGRGVVDFLHGRLELGTRSVWHTLEETRGDYLGSIDTLEEDEDHAPTRFFATAIPHPYVGVELSWDELRVATLTSYDGHNDGYIVMKGPLLSVMGRYPNPTPFVPYAGIGLAIYSGSFDSDTWYRLGYPSEQYWIDAGRSSQRHYGLERVITVDDETARFLVAGASAFVTPHLALDVCVRRTDVDASGGFTVYRAGRVVNHRITYETPLEHSTVALGVKYAF